MKKGFTRFRIKFIRSDQIIGDRRCRFTKHIGNNSIKSNITNGKGILETVFFTPFATGQFETVSGVFPKDTDFLTGNKTAGNNTKAEKIANPFGIFGIIFVAFNSFYPFRISNGNIDPVFQEIKNGNPILTGRFHTDIKTGIIKEPLFETADITVESRETFFLVGRLDAFGSFDDCGDEKGFMNIDATTG